MKNKVFFGLLAITLALGLAGCSMDGGTEDSYTVTFNLEGGGIGDKYGSVSVPVKAGETISELPVPRRANYTFGGWFTEQNGLGNEFTASTRVSSNLAVFAKWTAKNIFEGEWHGTVSGGALDGQSILFVCKGTNWHYSTDSKYGHKGTYTHNGSTAYMTITHQTNDGTTWSDDLTGLPASTFTAAISGGALSANGTTFTKENETNANHTLNAGNFVSTLEGIKDKPGTYNITLTSDVTTDTYISLEAGVKIILNGGGKKITSQTATSIFSVDGAELILENISLSTAATGQACVVWVGEGGSLTLKTGVVISTPARAIGGVWLANGGNVIMEDGKIENCTQGIGTDGEDVSINHKGRRNQR
jgi:uncharacterized repeat protein (TIGR02543 family)